MEYTDLDLDVQNAIKRLDTTTDVIIYFRKCKNEGLSVYGGTPENIINLLVQVMEDLPDFYDLLSTALEAFESDAVIIFED